MNPQAIFCPNPDCPARGRSDAGNIHRHGRTPPRYRCTVCRTTFSERAGTPFYRRSTDEMTIALVVTLVANGCPIAAIVAAFGIQRQTICAWLDAAGSQCEAIHRHCICQPRDVGAVQADEVRVRQQGRVVWLAMAMVVATRLWLGGVVSPRRDGAVIARLCALLKACMLPAPLLVLVDGFAADGKQVRRMTRAPLLRRGKRGRCSLGEWPGLVIGQVVKQRVDGRVVGVTRRLAHGTVAWATRLLNGGTIQTAYIERLNGTFRARLATLARRHPCGRTDRSPLGAWHVAGRHALQLLHPARQPGTRTDACNGKWDHRSSVERGRTAALPGASRSVATAGAPGATRTPTEGVATPRGAVGDVTTVPHTLTRGVGKYAKSNISMSRICCP